ncbi:MAG: ribbon-helix-helix protein, CopG family [Nitrospirae bacterium]|nr:ribbon-helix-helix protein, CopG family [Nitrospirota bacterium]
MKTAISIPDDLYEMVEELSEKLHLSRSRIFSEAVRDYLAKRRNEEILRQINVVYSEAETEEDKTIRKHAKKRYTRTLKAEKW